jgi:hypothetical protein
MSKSSDNVLLATRKGLIRMTNKGGSWNSELLSFSGIALSYAFQNPHDDVIWAALDTDHWGPKLHRSKDKGKSWEDVGMPTYPEDDEASPGKPASLDYIWLIANGHEDDPKRLYLGTEPGGLFQSDDGGDSFHLVKGLWNQPSRMEHWFGGGRDYPGLHSVVVDPRDRNRVLIGISVAGVFESLDDGETWQPRNKGLTADYLPNPHVEVGHDPHSLVISPSNPDVLWQQNHVGIFRSEDGAKNWTNISQPDGPAKFGFPIIVDEDDAETAWVTPAVSDEERIAINGAMCVARTNDGGKSWDIFRKGLPQSGSFDVVFRHAFDKSGDRLMMGTTTGNLFVSEDRGESWDTVSTFLPPIYSLRFVPI